METSATKAKNKYNDKAYDAIPLRVKKRYKEVIQSKAHSMGLSVNSYINRLIEMDIETDNNYPPA
ncbi:antitoxin [Faecalispora anaeroviscerum]|uniref:antitoxin n=1 Tax=Faecalispora anaeroviscerum TaxID=2991836 RepID=UPI0024B8D7AB|nr:antitoxin [Faecalispora anaeroviscerum]